MKLKTNIAFIDLSSVCDTVWRQNLLYKFNKVMNCNKLVTFLEGIFANDDFKFTWVTKGVGGEQWIIDSLKD